MIDTLKSQVLKIMKEYPKARDSDQWLTLKIWCMYYPSRIHYIDGITESPYAFLRDIMDLPREDNVKRVRAIIQNVDKMFLPTSLEVAKQRKINEQEWRDYILKSNGN